MEFFRSLNLKISPSEKERKLNLVRQEVDRITDKLGLEVDEGIKETVVILRAMGFPTTSSCAGHTGENGGGWGVPYVEVYAPSPKGWQEDKTNEDLRELWRQANLKERAKIQPLLDEFNSSRQNVPDDVRIHLDEMGFKAFRIQNVGLGRPATSESEALIMISKYRREMATFTTFLKAKYLSQ